MVHVWFFPKFHRFKLNFRHKSLLKRIHSDHKCFISNGKSISWNQNSWLTLIKVRESLTFVPRSYPVSVQLRVEVSVEQGLRWGRGGDRLGETGSSVGAVLQSPVPHRRKRRVRRVRGRVRLQRVPPAVDGRVGLTQILQMVESRAADWFQPRICLHPSFDHVNPNLLWTKCNEVTRPMKKSC